MKFTTHTIKVTLPSMKEHIRLIPLNDIHYDTESCDRERFNEFIRDNLDTMRPWDKVIGVGDWQDFASESERRSLTTAKVHASTRETFDKDAKRNCDKLLKKIIPYKDNFIGIIRGNHWWQFMHDLDDDMAGIETDQYFAREIGCPFLDDFCYINLVINFKNTTKSCLVGIVVCHGKAGGKLAGSTVNQVDDLRMIFPNADMYFMAHDHRKLAVPVSSLSVSYNRGKSYLRERTHWLLRGGCFKRAYVDGMEGYEVGKYRPNSLGGIVTEIGVRRSRVGGREVLSPDIRVRY